MLRRWHFHQLRVRARGYIQCVGVIFSDWRAQKMLENNYALKAHTTFAGHPLLPESISGM